MITFGYFDNRNNTQYSNNVVKFVVENKGVSRLCEIGNNVVLKWQRKVAEPRKTVK